MNGIVIMRSKLQRQKQQTGMVFNYWSYYTCNSCNFKFIIHLL